MNKTNTYISQKYSKNGFAKTGLLLGLVLLVIVSFLIYYFIQNNKIETLSQDVPQYLLSQSSQENGVELSIYKPSAEELSQYDIKSYEIAEPEGVMYTSEKNRKTILEEVYNLRTQDGWQAIAGTNTYDTYTVLKLKNSFGNTLIYKVEDAPNNGSVVKTIKIINSLIQQNAK